MNLEKGEGKTSALEERGCRTVAFLQLRVSEKGNMKESRRVSADEERPRASRGWVSKLAVQICT